VLRLARAFSASIATSVFESGAVCYPTLLGVPIIVGAVLGWRKPERRALWILLAVVLALVLLDFAFDDTRFEDIPFFVVVGVFLFGLGLLVRAIAKALARRRRTSALSTFTTWRRRPRGRPPAR
jgi:RsiW-degrading membrane proteinase PrsW (M82 family)